MATLPTTQDIRDELEGYGITTSIISDAWLTRRMNNFIIPKIEQWTRLSISTAEQKTYTEYVSGTGSDVIYLSRRPISEIVEIRYITATDYENKINLSSVQLLNNEGAIKQLTSLSEFSGVRRLFYKGNKNILVSYKAGFQTDNIPADLCEAIIYLTAEVALGQIASRTGGGDLSVQAFSRSYGERGKYTKIRDDLSRQAMSIIKKYITPIVGT